VSVGRETLRRAPPGDRGISTRTGRHTMEWAILELGFVA
jgi:hypothetical protein